MFQQRILGHSFNALKLTRLDKSSESYRHGDHDRRKSAGILSSSNSCVQSTFSSFQCHYSCSTNIDARQHFLKKKRSKFFISICLKILQTLKEF